jgi:hypothetical protein
VKCTIKEIMKKTDGQIDRTGQDRRKTVDPRNPRHFSLFNLVKM